MTPTICDPLDRLPCGNDLVINPSLFKLTSSWTSLYLLKQLTTMELCFKRQLYFGFIDVRQDNPRENSRKNIGHQYTNIPTAFLNINILSERQKSNNDVKTLGENTQLAPPYFSCDQGPAQQPTQQYKDANKDQALHRKFPGEKEEWNELCNGNVGDHTGLCVIHAHTFFCT